MNATFVLIVQGTLYQAMRGCRAHGLVPMRVVVGDNECRVDVPDSPGVRDAIVRWSTGWFGDPLIALLSWRTLGEEVRA